MDNYENNNQLNNNENQVPEQNYNPQSYAPQEYQPQDYQPQQNFRQPEYTAPQDYNTQPQAYTAQNYNSQMEQELPESKNDGKAIASMVLGIVSLVCCGGMFACPIVGLILGIISKKERPNNNPMATAGIVMCVIALAFIVVYTVLMIVGIVQYPFSNPHYSYSYNSLY